jgi:hypothetical protein
MTSEEIIEEILIDSESLGIRTKVIELSRKLRESEPKININKSIEIAYNTLKKERP